MRLELHRTYVTDHATLGKLYVDGVFECFTLEDVVRDFGPNGAGKVFGETAIPAGTYKVILNLSRRFGRFMPRLLNVPFFDGILIHKGNTDADTHGCILVGDAIENDVIEAGTSTPAFNHLYPQLQDAPGEISIVITDDFNS